MNALIPIRDTQMPDGPVQTVNARDLHAFLGINKDYSSWIKAQVERARLKEGRDYLLTQKGEQLPSGTKWRIEYFLTLDAAKHIAMMSGTEKGFEVREYFLEIERRALAPRIVTPAYTRRANDNNDRVKKGYFSVISELAVRLHGPLEIAGYVMPDKAPDGKELQPEVSVGQVFARWLPENHPELADKFIKYMHKTSRGEFEARQYELCVLEIFILFVIDVWIPNYAENYFRKRDPVALDYLPKRLATAK